MNGWGPQKYNRLYRVSELPAMQCTLKKRGVRGGTKYIGLGTHCPIGGTPQKCPLIRVQGLPPHAMAPSPRKRMNKKEVLTGQKRDPMDIEYTNQIISRVLWSGESFGWYIFVIYPNFVKPLGWQLKKKTKQFVLMQGRGGGCSREECFFFFFEWSIIIRKELNHTNLGCCLQQARWKKVCRFPSLSTYVTES